MTTPAEEMAAPASSRGSQLLSNITSVSKRISAAASASSQQKPIRLVAVSKLKPASDILSLYAPNPAPPTTPQFDRQLHFGENYLQELLEKSRALPPEIRWHFIGGLQSNKCVTLARDVKGLWAVESVDSEKKAGLLNRGWGERKIADDGDQSEGGGEEKRPLRVFVQVNTSGEESKSGVEPTETVKLCRFIREKCPRLKLQGLMTIGAIARSKATTTETENEDFVCLRETRDRVVEDLGLAAEGGLELSMGMSEDFEKAIMMGSDQVRVGSTIFGERPPKAQAPVSS
jgi:pyridoxal phosphate enzyme (YggS family)